jgi:hypothetical protein
MSVFASRVSVGVRVLGHVAPRQFVVAPAPALVESVVAAEASARVV